MKYTVSVNEKSKVITVTLADGTVGTAKCCDTDQFNLATGIELALERAKVAKANAEKPVVTKSGDVLELVKALEKALPKGEMVIVGNGEGLTEAQKAFLHSLTDCKCDCEECDCCEGYTQEEYDDAIDEAYEDGKADGYEEARRELAEEYEEKLEELRETLHELINEYV